MDYPSTISSIEMLNLLPNFDSPSKRVLSQKLVLVGLFIHKLMGMWNEKFKHLEDMLRASVIDFHEKY